MESLVGKKKEKKLIFGRTLLRVFMIMSSSFQPMVATLRLAAEMATVVILRDCYSWCLDNGKYSYAAIDVVLIIS